MPAVDERMIVEARNEWTVNAPESTGRRGGSEGSEVYGSGEFGTVSFAWLNFFFRTRMSWLEQKLYPSEFSIHDVVLPLA